MTADCGAALDECGVYVIDRVSGERRQIEVLVDGVAASFVESAANYGYSSSPNNISPDGRFSVAMVNANTNPQYGLVDLESGEYFRLGDYPESSLWWAPDSTDRDVRVAGPTTRTRSGHP